MAAVIPTPTVADPAPSAAAASATFAADGIVVPPDCIVIVTNASGGSTNVTVTTPEQRDGNAVADPVTAVADGTARAFGRFIPATYAIPDGSTNEGLVTLVSSVTTGVTYRVIEP